MRSFRPKMSMDTENSQLSNEIEPKRSSLNVYCLVVIVSNRIEPSWWLNMLSNSSQNPTKVKIKSNRRRICVAFYRCQGLGSFSVQHNLIINKQPRGGKNNRELWRKRKKWFWRKPILIQRKMNDRSKQKHFWINCHGIFIKKNCFVCEKLIWKIVEIIKIIRIICCNNRAWIW